MFFPSTEILRFTLACFIVSSFVLPIERRQDEQTVEKRQVPVHAMISIQTGSMVHLHPDGNVSATHNSQAEGALPGRFFIRHGSSSDNGKFRHNLSLTSLDHNGSYLHFVQLVPVSVNESLQDDFNITLNDETFNDTLNETAKNETVTTVETVPMLLLVLGAIDGEDKEGMIRHTMWTEETHGSYYRYSVTLDDGKVCYLAFDEHGVPVENPCLTHEELAEKHCFSYIPPTDNRGN